MIAQASQDAFDLFGVLPLAPPAFIIWAMVTGRFVPAHIRHQMDENRHRTEHAIHDLTNAIEKSTDRVLRLEAEPVPFDPDYAAIGTIRPEFSDSGDLRWYRKL